MGENICKLRIQLWLIPSVCIYICKISKPNRTKPINSGNEQMYEGLDNKFCIFTTEYYPAIKIN